MAHLLRDSDAMTIYIGCPDLLDGQEGRRVVATVYRDLLGMQQYEPYGGLALQRRAPDEDYIAGRTTDGGSKLRLAFDDWLVGAATAALARSGVSAAAASGHLRAGSRQRRRARHQPGSNPASGQRRIPQLRRPSRPPVRLYPDPAIDTPIVGRVVFDCFSPRALAAFYQGLLGVPDRLDDSPEWVVINLDDDDDLPNLAFQHAQFRAARWPDPEYPAQIHVDYRFPDQNPNPVAMARAEQLGAIHIPGPAVTYADPAGHPFCF